MISIDDFKQIRTTRHLIVLDTNILLELYRQPANISLDVIEALKKVVDNLFIPRQVYDEYLKNYQTVCGGEKKKYQKVRRELLESIRKLQDDILTKITEYRKHNYTDISQLQSNLDEKILNIHDIIKNFEKEHQAEQQLSLNFLNNDRVKEFKDEIPYNLLAMLNQPYRIDGKMLKRVLDTTACTMVGKSIDAVVRKYVADNKNIIEKKLIEAYDMAIKEYQRQLKFTKESGHYSQEEIQETEKDLSFDIDRVNQLKENSQKIVDLLVADVNDALDEYSTSDKVFSFFNKNTLLETIKPLRKIYLEQSTHQKITNQDVIEDTNRRSELFKEVPVDEFCQFFSIKEEKTLNSTPKVRKLSNPNDSNK